MESAQFSSILILSFFEGKNRWIGLLVMLILPHITSFINKIKAKILYWWYPTTVSIILTQKQNKDGIPLYNFSYKSMCWYTISEHCEKQKSLFCETDSTKVNEKIGDKHKRIPDYVPNDSLKIKYNDTVISFSFHSSNETKSITLQSEKMITLTTFVSYVNDLYEKYCFSTLDSSKIYVCEWKNIKRYNDTGDFIPHEMNIMKTYNNIYLPSNLINSIKKDILEFKSNEEFYKENGIPYKRGYLFYGPPGTGKTSTAYAIARENKMNLYKLNLSDAKNDTSLKQIIQKIPVNSVILIEEVDAQVFNDRTSSVTAPIVIPEKSDAPINIQSGKKIPMSQLMEVLDGYDTFHGCLIILTTNHKEFLDKALIRPGRVDMHYLFDELKSVDIKSTIKRFTGFDIDVSSDFVMTSSTLLNQILLPNRRDKLGIQKLISNKNHN